MDATTFLFDSEQFNRLFPFYMLINSDLKICEYGKSLEKIIPNLYGESFNSTFFITQPKTFETSFSTLRQIVNQLVILESAIDNKINLKGQLEFLPASNQILFVGSPLLSSIEEINLNLTDFAAHDTLIDSFNVLKTQKIANDGIKKLLRILNNQQNELDRLTYIAEETINGVVITDSNARIQWVNKAFTRITGYTLSEAAGKVPGSFLQGHASDPKTKAYLHDKVHNFLPFECEILNYSKSGTPYWVKISGQPIFDKQGNATQFFALVENITQRKEAEESLIKAEERWQFALEGNGDGLWEYNFQTKEIFYSEGYKKMLGFSDSDFKNELYEWSSRIHSEDLPVIEKTDRDYEEGLINNHQREYRIRNKQGDFLWILDRGMIISRTPDGKPLRMIGTHTNITQRKLIAISLEQSEKQFRTLSENIPGVVYEYAFYPDDTHGFTFVSSTIEKLFGLTPDELKDLRKCVYPFDQKLLFEKINQVRNTNESFSYEGRLITPHKGIMWHSASASFSYQLQDGTRIFTGIILDITEKKLAEKKIEDQRRFYEDVLNQIPADITVFDVQHTYKFLNPVAIKDPELRKWLIGKKDKDYCIAKNKPKRVAEERKNLFDQVIKSKKQHSWEEQVMNSEGKTEYHLKNLYPVMDEKGEISLVIGYGINITERKEIENKLALNEKRYRDLFNYSQALIYTLDLKGKILSVNPAICELLGYSSEELIGKMLTDFIPLKDIENFQGTYLEKIIKEEKVKGVFRVRHKNGNKSFLLYQNYKVREEGLEPYVIGFSQDITERIKAEKELVLAKKMTEDASHAKEVFLANMSHEIRTPMSGILGVAGLLAKTPLNEQQKDYTKLISESANNLLVIVNDVLDIEKIASGKFEFEHMQFKISEKVNTTIQSFRYKAEEKGLQIDFENNLQNDLIVEGDPYRLSQILNNLLSNALKFTEHGKIMITSSLLKNEEGIATLKFTVSDTGIGIPDNRLHAIFEPFVQASTDTTRKYGGTGLGLSICKNLVEMQGGEISANSEQDKGTTFSFVIPYKISSKALISEEIKEEVNYKEIGKKKILVAEDVELNQFLAKHILESWGFTVDIANNGKEAVTSVSERNYDLILMDIQMPEMDGIEATQTIRKFEIPGKANIPIIALTANALKGDGQRYLEAGMNDYITKPYTEERLYKVISKFLKPDKPAETNTKTDIDEKAPLKKLYNLSMINIIGKDSPVFAEKMIKLFINTIPSDLQTLEEATTKEDYQKVSFIAHKMKSTIDSMGINSISNTIRKLEMKDEKKVSKETIRSWSNEVDTILKQVIIQMQTDFQDII